MFNKKNTSIVIFLLLSLLLNTSGRRVVLQVVGKVGGQFITSRQVQIAYAIENILFPKETVSSKLSIEMDLDSSLFKTESTALILESVVAQEAINFNVSKVSEADIKKSYEKVLNATKNSSYFKSLKADENELKKMIENKIVAKNFLQFKTNSMATIISDAEAKLYFEQNSQKFSSVTFESMKKNIRDFLSRQQTEDRLKTWFEIIRKKYDVKVFI